MRFVTPLHPDDLKAKTAKSPSPAPGLPDASMGASRSKVSEKIVGNSKRTSHDTNGQKFIWLYGSNAIFSFFEKKNSSFQSKSAKLPNEVEPKVRAVIKPGTEGVHRKLEIERFEQNGSILLRTAGFRQCDRSFDSFVFFLFPMFNQKTTKLSINVDSKSCS
jgi:hypothetical protein